MSPSATTLHRVDESVPRLTLLSRGYCHLCDDMRAVVESIRPEFRFELDVIDVDSDEELERHYSEDVPVLLCGDREIARHRLDADFLRRFLARGKSEI